MKRILVLTDSLGLPRDTPEKVIYEQSWPYLLREMGYTVVQASVGGGTSYDLYKQAAYYKMFYPDIVLLQVGIVDCAPHALTFYENIFFNHYYLSRKILSFILSRWGKTWRKVRGISYVDPAEFQENIRGIIQFVPESKVYAIGILPVSDGYEKKVPGIREKVKKYNDLLAGLFKKNYISMEDMPLSYIMSDYHHPNVSGHRFIMEKLVSYLEYGTT